MKLKDTLEMEEVMDRDLTVGFWFPGRWDFVIDLKWTGVVFFPSKELFSGLGRLWWLYQGSWISLIFQLIRNQMLNMKIQVMLDVCFALLHTRDYLFCFFFVFSTCILSWVYFSCMSSFKFFFFVPIVIPVHELSFVFTYYFLFWTD